MRARTGLGHSRADRGRRGVHRIQIGVVVVALLGDHRIPHVRTRSAIDTKHCEIKHGSSAGIRYVYTRHHFTNRANASRRRCGVVVCQVAHCWQHVPAREAVDLIGMSIAQQTAQRANRTYGGGGFLDAHTTGEGIVGRAVRVLIHRTVSVSVTVSVTVRAVSVTVTVTVSVRVTVSAVSVSVSVRLSVTATVSVCVSGALGLQ